MWLGHNGRPATLYLFARKPLPKKPVTRKGVRTHGAQRLTLYERRDYFRQLGLQPEFGDAPVTRAEVSKRWKNHRPSLSSLPKLANLLEGRRVAYAAEAIKTNRPLDWVRFCMATFGAGTDKAMWLWLTKGGLKFAKAYNSCAGDLVSADWWETWPQGLAMTGLAVWIAASGAGVEPQGEH